MSGEHPRALESICALPWLITEDGLRQVLTVAEGMRDIEALQSKRDARLERGERAGFRNGVATLNLIGPVFRYSNLLTEVSGATSLELLARDFQVALDDPRVNGILLNIDSPGGQAAGIAEFVAIIRAAPKPVWAYVDELGASAAYWIASAASRVVSSRTALVGSIGVVASYRKRDGKDQTIEIVSSQSPNKRLDVETDAGRSAAQTIVDNLAAVFVADIARHRRVSEKFVSSDFGAGGLLFAAAAQKVRMIDGIGQFDAVHAALAGFASNPAHRRIPMSDATQGQVKVNDTESLRKALAAGFGPDQLTVETDPAALSAARAEGHAQGVAECETRIASARTQERQRIAGIQALTMGGFEALALSAIEQGDSPEQFALKQVQAVKDRGITLDAIRRDAPSPAPHAAPRADGTTSTADTGSLRRLVREQHRQKTAKN